MGLIENAFNYDVYGDEGFALLRALVDRSDCFSFSYSQVEDAALQFERLAQTAAPAAAAAGASP
jgi:hypothetical protein